MPKGAVIIISECKQLEVIDWCAEAGKHESCAWPSDRLLSDLRTLVKAGEWATTIADWDPWRRKAIELSTARVRALLPEEES